MGAAPSEYDAVIADLESEILELQTTVETLKRKRDKGSAGEPGTGITIPRQPVREPVRRLDTAPVEFPADLFLKMSIPEAVKTYLRMVKRKQSTKQLMEVLDRGGYPHRSKNFYTTVFGVLNRHSKTKGEIAKVDGDWGLREWYRSLPNEKKSRSRETDSATESAETKDSK